MFGYFTGTGKISLKSMFGYFTGTSKIASSKKKKKKKKKWWCGGRPNKNVWGKTDRK